MVVRCADKQGSKMTDIFQKIFYSQEKIAEIQQYKEIKSLISVNQIHQKKYKYMTMYHIETADYEIDADCMFTSRYIEAAPHRESYFLMYIHKKPGDKKNTVTIQDEKFAKRIYKKMQRKWNRNNNHVR